MVPTPNRPHRYTAAPTPSPAPDTRGMAASPPLSVAPPGARRCVATGPSMTRPAGPNWPLFSVLPPMGALTTAPRMARMHLRDTLKEWSLPELIDDGELIASELVTNVVRRAHDPMTGLPVYVNGRLPVLQLGLFSDRAQLLISVWDQFSDPPVRKVATADDEAGRGLMMVGRISASLDWYPVQGGKVVRALLPVTA
jgi:anti-sigma regulatory factor (Ser/Thr protein kinase)